MKTLLRWLGIGLSVVIGLVLIGVAAAYALSNRKIYKRYAPGVEFVAVPNDSESIAHGRHFVQAVTKCMDCHGEDLGGTAFIDNPAFGHIPAPNITRGTGGRTAGYTDLDWVRIIRHGVTRDGRAAIVMPSEYFTHLSDYDLGSMIAYLKTVTPVNRTWPDPVFGPVGRGLIAFGGATVFAAAQIHHDRLDVKPAPAPDTTAAYGDYLVDIGGCRVCHNPALSGGKAGGDPEAPPAANLTPGGIGGWKEADFVRVLREGKRPYTDQAVDRHMPWKSSGLMTDAEIHAVWLFLLTLPSKEIGQQ